MDLKDTYMMPNNMYQAPSQMLYTEELFQTLQQPYEAGTIMAILK